jgi:hypothetical protein
VLEAARAHSHNPEQLLSIVDVVQAQAAVEGAVGVAEEATSLACGAPGLAGDGGLDTRWQGLQSAGRGGQVVVGLRSIVKHTLVIDGLQRGLGCTGRWVGCDVHTGGAGVHGCVEHAIHRDCNSDE